MTIKGGDHIVCRSLIRVKTYLFLKSFYRFTYAFILINKHFLNSCNVTAYTNPGF